MSEVTSGGRPRVTRGPPVLMPLLGEEVTWKDPAGPWVVTLDESKSTGGQAVWTSSLFGFDADVVVLSDLMLPSIPYAAKYCTEALG